MYMLDRYLKLLEIVIWVKTNCIFNMQISYLSRNNGFQRCGQDKCFFKFSRGVFNFMSISVVDSISVMSKYNMMQF